MFYFYSNERQGLKEYLSYKKNLHIKLTSDGVMICQGFIDLRDFNSSFVDKKDYYFPLIGELPTPALKCTIGISQGDMLEEVCKVDLK